MADSDAGRYGSMRRPEKRKGIHIDRDMSAVVAAAYEVYALTADKAFKGKSFPYNDAAFVEDLYGEACRLLEDAGDLSPDGAEVVRLLRGKAMDRQGTGMYMSALLNRTGMRELWIDEFPLMEEIGYRIEKGKTLILGKKSRAVSAGRYGKGMVLNWGILDCLSTSASEGLYVNWGVVRDDMGERVKGGVHANAGAAKFLAHEAAGGVGINFGTVRDWMANFAQGGFQGNWGYAASFGLGGRGGLLYNGGNAGSIGSFAELRPKCINDGVVSENIMGKAFVSAPGRPLAGMTAELNGRVAEIGFLADMKRPSREALERVKGYDFAGFEKDVLAIAGKIENYLEGAWLTQADMEQ